MKIDVTQTFPSNYRKPQTPNATLHGLFARHARKTPLAYAADLTPPYEIH